ncbi:MAG: glycoside hydrolase family 130 protein [Spirochaetes bacterium]|nr:glycoside hydrolase family 130 protein [Spirochaetota bacterium]
MDLKQLKSSPVMVRHAKNPLLTPKDIPFPSDNVYNVGVIKYQGKYVMIFRNDFERGEKEMDDFYSGRSPKHPAARICLGLATSADGVAWAIEPKPVFQLETDEIERAYDPRLTVVDGKVVMCFATDTKHGLRAGIAVTEDFHHFDVKHFTVPDNRNMVLFPERIGGLYVRLERPFPVYSRGGKDRFDLWASRSPDLEFWGRSDLVLAVEDVPFSNDKIGPAAPPVKTARGWLTSFHAVDRDDTRGKNGWEPKWTKRYTAGIMLLDLQNPSKVVGMCKEPLLVPEAPYEVAGGMRNNVIFPGGMILEPTGEVKLYYGAADTVTCLATAHVDDLLSLCTSPRHGAK